MRFMKEKKQAVFDRLKTRGAAKGTIDSVRAEGIVENDVIGTEMSSRVQLSRFIKEELRGSISRQSFLHIPAAAENMNATALRRSLMVRTSITSSLGTEAMKLSSLVGRCVYTSEVGSQSFFYFGKFGSFDCACSTLKM